MPVITINNPNSQANGQSAFWFDKEKPRRASKDAKKQALRRLNQYMAMSNEGKVRRNQVDSVHHLNQDRSNGHPDNLFVCTDADQHNRIELQSTELFTTLFDMGKVGFDYASKKYFIACKWLDQEIKEWVDKGSQLNWQIFSKPSN